jgi:hypothetical protein
VTLTLTDSVSGQPILVESERVDSVTDQPALGGDPTCFITYYLEGSDYLIGVHVQHSAGELAPLLGFNS